MDLWGLLEAILAELGNRDFLVRVIAATFAAIVVALIPFAIRWAWRRFRQNLNWREQSVSLQKRLDEAAAAVDGDSMWLKQPIKQPDNYELRMRSSIPVLTLANLKGGVGKTTLSANLAAYFAVARSERVLAIDLDFQGSLTSMTLPQSYGAERSRAWHLVTGNGLMTGIAAQPVVLPVVGHDGHGRAHTNHGFLKAIDAYFDVADAETEVLVKWLIGESDRDIRYFLAETLLSEDVQKNFDRVILDAPPRMTASAIQAFCASTHVLIPTILDRLSGVAVGSLVNSLEQHRKLWPHLKTLGVVGVMTGMNVGTGRALAVQEREGMEAVEDELRAVQRAHNLAAPPGGLLPVETFIASKAAFKRFAGQRITYAEDGNDAGLQEAREMVERLGEVVAERMAVR